MALRRKVARTATAKRNGWESNKRANIIAETCIQIMGCLNSFLAECNYPYRKFFSFCSGAAAFTTDAMTYRRAVISLKHIVLLWISMSPEIGVSFG
jgi:hypothetical protein